MSLGDIYSIIGYKWRLKDFSKLSSIPDTNGIDTSFNFSSSTTVFKKWGKI